jgi:hypothetical protein
MALDGLQHEETPRYEIGGFMNSWLVFRIEIDLWESLASRNQLLPDISQDEQNEIQYWRLLEARNKQK